LEDIIRSERSKRMEAETRLNEWTQKMRNIPEKPIEFQVEIVKEDSQGDKDLQRIVKEQKIGKNYQVIFIVLNVFVI
jgi:hypothetical protein